MQNFKIEICENVNFIDLVHHNTSIIVNLINKKYKEYLLDLDISDNEFFIDGNDVSDILPRRMDKNDVIKYFEYFQSYYDNSENIKRDIFFITPKFQHNIEFLTKNTLYNKKETSIYTMSFFILGMAEGYYQLLLYQQQDLFYSLFSDLCGYSLEDIYEYFTKSLKNSYSYYMPIYLNMHMTLESNYQLYSEVMFSRYLGNKDLPYFEIDLSNSLDIDKFASLENKINDIVSIATNKSDACIFIYGDVGLGKSELSKTISKISGKKLIKINLLPQLYTGSIESYDKIDVIGILNNIHSTFGNKDIIILIDEAHDIFINEALGCYSDSELHEILEYNIPKLIVSKRADFKYSFIRRSDYILKLKYEHHKNNIKRMLDENLNDSISEKLKNKIINTDGLNISVINKCINFIKIKKNYTEKDILKYFNSYLKSISYNKISYDNTIDNQKEKKKNDDLYNIEYINTNVNLDKIINTLNSLENKTARILLYGEPGTGKSEFAKNIANRLSLEYTLLIASDILSKYVGESEIKVKEYFTKADKDKKVLIIDEIDSFLRNRSNFSQNHEISLTNELLSRMENFEGIFIGTTNNLDLLDKASIRRFDLVVEFKFISADMIYKIFNAYSAKLNLENNMSIENLERELSILNNVSLGDFQAIFRRCKFEPIENTEEFLKFLQEIASTKSLLSNNKIIGFK